MYHCMGIPNRFANLLPSAMIGTIPTRFLTPALRRTSTVAAPRFIPSQLDNVENAENYQPGGYHPISIGDVFDQGRYRILHKLGSGDSSTVWLVRDQREGKDRGRIVTPKAMRADIFSQSPSDTPELAIPKKRIVSPSFPLCRLPNCRSPFPSTRPQRHPPLSRIPSCWPERPRHVRLPRSSCRESATACRLGQEGRETNGDNVVPHALCGYRSRRQAVFSTFPALSVAKK